jgi:hypothetical protein
LNVTAEILTKAGSMISLKHPDGKDKAVGTVTVVNAQARARCCGRTRTHARQTCNAMRGSHARCARSFTLAR